MDRPKSFSVVLLMVVSLYPVAGVGRSEGVTVEWTVPGSVEVEAVEAYEEPLHDVLVSNLTASPATVWRGGGVSILVIVRNRGTFSESFTLRVAAEAPPPPRYPGSLVTIREYALIARVTGHIMPDELETFHFTLNTSSLEPGEALIHATVLEADNVTANNYMTAPIRVTGLSKTLRAILPPLITAWVILVIGLLIIVIVQRREKPGTRLDVSIRHYSPP